MCHLTKQHARQNSRLNHSALQQDSITIIALHKGQKTTHYTIIITVVSD